jgi:16S rRNA (guanine527-N7)-methyltransferase
MSGLDMTDGQVIQAAAAVGVSLTDTQAQAVRTYVAGLAKWNKVYNLTAIRNQDEVWTHHVMDCLAVVPPIQKRLPGLTEILDVGSGGGLPGIILAITETAERVTCVDAVAKKVAFINQMAAVLSGIPTRLHGVHHRVEEWTGSYPLITSRAFSSLIDFVQLTRHLLSPNGVWMAMKGKIPEQEIANLPSNIDVFHVEQLLVPGLNEDRCLVWMRQR